MPSVHIALRGSEDLQATYLPADPKDKHGTGYVKGKIWVDGAGAPFPLRAEVVVDKAAWLDATKAKPGEDWCAHRLVRFEFAPDR